MRDRRTSNFVAALRCRLRRTSSHRCSAAHPLAAPAACRTTQPPLDSRRSPKFLTVSAVGRRLSPHQSSGAPSRAHGDRAPNPIEGCASGPLAQLVAGPGALQLCQLDHPRMPGPPTSAVWQPAPPTTGLVVTGLACPTAQGLQRLHTAGGIGGTLVRPRVAPQRLGRGLTQVHM